jgi:hypothetical protein
VQVQPGVGREVCPLRLNAHHRRHLFLHHRHPLRLRLRRQSPQ